MSVTTRRRSASVTACLPVLVASLAFAQEVPEDLEEIIVTGSRIRQRLEDAIGKVVQQLPANTSPASYPLLGRTYFVSLSYRIE